MYVGSVVPRNQQYTNVLLAPISDNDQVDVNLEPQFVRVRSGNNAFLYMDSTQPRFEVKSDKVRISSSTVNGTNDQNLLNGISRVGITNFEMFWQPLNITPYNNNWSWSLHNNTNVPSVITSFAHTLVSTLPGYLDVNEILDAFKDQMNADVVSVLGSGIYFDYTLSSNGKTALFSATSTLPASYGFSFDSKCNFIVKGQSVMSMPKNDTSRRAWSLGPARLLYSKYVDVISNELCIFVKNPSKSINRVSDNVIFRQTLVKPNDNWVYGGKELVNLSWMNWNPQAPGTYFNVELFDENGDAFYYAPAPDGNNSTLNWTMKLIIEA